MPLRTQGKENGREKADSGSWKEGMGRRKWRMIEEGDVMLSLGAEMLVCVKGGSKFGRKSIYLLIWFGRGESFYFSFFNLSSKTECVCSLLDTDA